jgi:hypothetical protein
MANLIGLEWDDREARVVAGATRGAQLVVEHAFSISWPTPPEGGKPTAPPAAEIGRRLADELTARRIPRGDVLVALGRAAVELKPLSLPPAPDDELPDMVRLQSQREFTTLHEGSPIDFIPLGGSDTEPRSVLAAAVSPEVLKQVRQVCEGADLELERLTLRPCGAAALLNRSYPRAERVKLLVDLLWDDVDLTVLVGDQVNYLRTVRLPVDATTGDVARPLVAEIRRTMAAAQNQLGAQRVEAVYFCGDQRQAAAAAPLEKALDQPVRTFDPFGGLELGAALRSSGVVEASRFAPLLGMLAEEAAGTRPAIDFLHPRRRPPKKTRTQRARPLALAAAAVLAITALGYYWRLSSLDAQIAARQNDLKLAQQEAGKFDRIRREYEALEAWQKSDITWLDELAALSQAVSPPQAALLTGLTLDAGGPKAAPQIKLNGLARDLPAIDSISARLRKHAKLDSGKLDKDTKLANYPEKFDATLTLERRDKAALRQRLSADPNTDAAAQPAPDAQPTAGGEKAAEPVPPPQAARGPTAASTPPAGPPPSAGEPPAEGEQADRAEPQPATPQAVAAPASAANPPAAAPAPAEAVAPEKGT